MRHANTIGLSLILLGTSLCAAPAQAQSDQQPSVAEAARKARAEKKSEKPIPVVTNDTLGPPSAKPAVSTVGPAEATQGAVADAAGAPASGGSATAEGKPASGTKPADAEKDTEAKKELEALKQQIRDRKKEVDLAQRALSLANEDFYSKPDFSGNPEGKAKLDAMKSDLSEKMDKLAQLIAQLPAGESADEPKAPAPQPQ